MDDTLYSYYEIEIADIWEYEREQFLNGLLTREHAQDLMELAQHYIIKNNEPIFGTSMYDKGTMQEQAYYSRKIKEYVSNLGNLDQLYRLNLFFHDNNCFDYDHVIIVKLKDGNFPYFFSLKLRQYNGNLFELSNFLTFQLKKSFKNDEVKYKEFLSLLLLQHADFFDDRIKTLINDFIIKSHKRQKRIKTEKTIDKDKPLEKKETELFQHTTTVWQYALFYVYIISSKEHKRIDQIAKVRKEAFAILAAKHNISANSFKQYFGFYDKVNLRNGKIISPKRTSKTIRDDIQFVMDNMLAKYPKALALAQADLSQINLKT